MIDQRERIEEEGGREWLGNIEYDKGKGKGEDRDRERGGMGIKKENPTT